jgi:drug/metabolite transporter (DMT)-like permease
MSRQYPDLMPSGERPLAAAVWMLGAVFAFTAMAVAGRKASAFHDTFEIMLWRSCIGFVLVFAFATLTGRLIEARTRHFGQHLARNLVHFTGQNLWLWSLTLIPIAQVFALEFTSPLWVILLSPLLFGDKLSRPRKWAAALGFMGILIVARPNVTELNPGVLAALGAAVCFATTIVLTKALTKGESVISILFWLTLMQFFFGAIAALADGQMDWPTTASLPWLIAVGVSGVTAHMCLTTALSLARTSFVMPIDFLRLPLIAVVGMVLFDEPLEAPVLIGGLVILIANWINIRFGDAKPRPVIRSTNG